MPGEKANPLDLKTVYTEIGTNYRYFLNWRHRLFAGYLAVLASLSIAYSWTLKDDGSLTWVVPMASFVLTIVFWVAEFRNRDLYHACQESGEACKEGLPTRVGFYTQLKTKKRPLRNHSRAMDLLFLLVLLVSAAAAAYELRAKHGKQDSDVGRNPTGTAAFDQSRRDT